MWRIKFRTCITIILLINLIGIIVVLFMAVGNGFESMPITSNPEDFEERIMRHSNRNLDMKSGSEGEVLRKFVLEKIDDEETERYIKHISRKKYPEENNSAQLDEDPIDDQPLFNSVTFKQTQKNLQHKFVHLDLKGAPPKLEYLRSILPLLQAAGATGILIEYEDMFPYEGELEVITAGNAYNKNELLSFLEAVKGFDFEVIPLVQTFGHLEYVLKLEGFRGLREEDAHPDSICPSKKMSFDVITGMIDQVIKFHMKKLDLKRIHIGCDEVYHINQCHDCSKKNLTARQTFVNHVAKVANYIKENYSNLTPLIWDDMLRGFKPLELETSGLGHLVQPVVWIYSTAITDLVPHRIWYQYMKIFSGVWIASAYKGASGSTQMIPNLRKYHDINLAWLEFAVSYKVPGSGDKYNFQGIFLTGWSRYDHFAVLCEMLPVSIPSLILNLLLVNNFIAESTITNIDKNPVKLHKNLKRKLFPQWETLLKCTKGDYKLSSLQKQTTTYLQEMEKKLHRCDFKGNKLYEDIMNVITNENVIINFHISNAFRKNGLLFYNVEHKYVHKLQNTFSVEKAVFFENNLDLLTKQFIRHLRDFFDSYTIQELIEYKIGPLKDMLKRITDVTNIVNNTRTWKKRPYM